MSKDLVSIIICTYNSQDYIKKCLDSIVSQTYKNIEIILVDDGSTDKTVEKIKEFEDKRISLYTPPHAGHSGALNFGIYHAKGEYIIFADPDDFVHVDYVKKLKDNIKNADVAVCKFYVEDFTNKETFKQFSKNVKHLTKKDIFKLLLIDTWEKRLAVYMPWGKLIKKSLINNNNLKYDTNLTATHDINFNLLMWTKAKDAVLIDEALYAYVKRQDSLSNDGRKPDQVCKGRIQFINNMLEIYTKEGYKNTDIMQGVYRQGIFSAEVLLVDLIRMKGCTKKICKKNIRAFYLDETIQECAENYTKNSSFIDKTVAYLIKHKLISVSSLCVLFCNKLKLLQ